MANVIKLNKGLDINLKGRAEEKKIQLKSNGKYALVPDDFEGVTPKVVVREGDKVQAGDALFVNKQYPEVKFASPVSGTVSAVVRGERRKVLCIKVDADAQQSYVDFGKKDVSKLDGKAVIDALLEAGLFGYIDQLPYAVSTNPSVMPKAIFVSALRDKPLACDFQFEAKGQEQDFVTGIQALSKIAKTHVGLGIQPDFQTEIRKLGIDQFAELTIFDGNSSLAVCSIRERSICVVLLPFAAVRSSRQPMLICWWVRNSLRCSPTATMPRRACVSSMVTCSQVAPLLKKAS